MNKDIYVVVPTLDPNIKIMDKFMDELIKNFSNIIVVNDGSKEKYNDYFNSLEKRGIVVLKHYINYGKGRALKTAFNYILNTYDNIESIVTCDSDGQHSVKDIIKCAEVSKENKDKLILGIRDFDKENVPLRSQFGNKITRSVFNMFVCSTITDTQTGLRAMSKNVAEKFLDTDGERFDYETKTLVECKIKNIKIKEVVIDTIYIDNNSESHFDAVKDSIKVYKNFSKYLLSFIFVSVLNILSFIFIYKIIDNSFLCNIISGFLSIFIYTVLNRKVVNRVKNILISFIFIIGSSALIFYLGKVINLYLSKILIDIFMFILLLIFNRKLFGSKNE